MNKQDELMIKNIDSLLRKDYIKDMRVLPSPDHQPTKCTILQLRTESSTRQGQKKTDNDGQPDHQT